MRSVEKFIIVRDKVKIFSQIKETGAPVWLIVTHGIGEYSDRHHYIQKLFGQEFNILFYDLRGHGRSEGKNVYIKDFRTFYQDLEDILDFLQNVYKAKRHILFGHSMGALITAGYMQKYAKAAFYPEKVFFSAPPVSFPGTLGKIIKQTPKRALKYLSEFIISVKLSGLIDLRVLSHDARVYEDYVKDEFNAKKLHSKLLFGLVKSSKLVFSKPLKIKCPAFCAVGSDDQIVSVEDIREYFSTIEKKVTLRIINDAYHEMHNEIEKYRLPYLEFLKESLITRQVQSANELKRKVGP
ncbi:MAG: alpha/beta fold hydrolase [Bacteriovoracaceae bacterium]|nr:alpha/beta fold hydrolase [Bacteriovoracaceae bacterium]